MRPSELFAPAMYGVPNAAPLGGAALDGAIRHLVRHIADPSELRKNPLVAERFAGARPPMIAAALPEGSGARGIVRPCDIGGPSHKAVVHELGISRRQFYRERA